MGTPVGEKVCTFVLDNDGMLVTRVPARLPENELSEVGNVKEVNFVKEERL